MIGIPKSQRREKAARAGGYIVHADEGGTIEIQI